MSETEFRLTAVECKAVLSERLSEPAPGRIQLLAGPRQVGKTTVVLELAAELGQRAIYAAADSPEATLPGFWDRLWATAEAAAAAPRGGAGSVVVFIDEAHLIQDWAARLKGEWDRCRRRTIPIHIVATGSSALHHGVGARESLAGRFERLTLTHWNATSLAAAFDLEPAQAARLLVERGGYPGAMSFRGDAARWTAYVRDAILEPAIGRDILAMGVVRKPALLRQVFGVCAASPAQIVSLQKIQGQLQDAGALETIAHYLALLEEAFLVAALPKFAARSARRRAAPPKLVPLSNALMAATDPAGAPAVDQDPARYGAWIENACLAHAWNAGQRVSYWREDPLEVDAVIEGSWGALVVEVKTGSSALTRADVLGLAEFTHRHPRFESLVICDATQVPDAARLGFRAMTWEAFLLGRPT
jgi:predicted AAA+ superfamily ATPase